MLKNIFIALFLIIPFISKADDFSRYQANTDGTVEDLETGLIWMRCAVGQKWDGNNCNGESKSFKWQAAKAINLNFADYSDWRLPTFDELRTLIYCSNGKPDYFSMAQDAAEKDSGCGGKPGKDHTIPTLANDIFPVASSWFIWSATSNGTTARVILPFNGSNDYRGSGHEGQVYLVRNKNDD